MFYDAKNIICTNQNQYRVLDLNMACLRVAEHIKIN